MTSYGIDYGHGKTNINLETHIRYGVIPERELDSFFDAAESDYGKPSCPQCGAEAMDASTMTDEQLDGWDGAETNLHDYACSKCEYVFASEEAYPEEAYGHYIDDGEYKMELHTDGDVFVTDSPYYTYAQFCSPCAPGACYLLNPLDDRHENNKCYCPGIDWYHDPSYCKYPVYSVETDECLYQPETNDTDEE